MLHSVFDNGVLLGTLERGMYMFLISLPFRQLPSVFNVSTSQISAINLHECYFVCL